MRTSVYLFINAALGVAFGTLYTFVVAWQGLSREALGIAFRDAGWAGLIVGLAIGAGASLGARPFLGWAKCVKAQAGVLLSTAFCALLWTLLPRELEEVDRSVQAELQRQGIRASSGVGAVLGTAIQMVQVYFTRRRAAARAK